MASWTQDHARGHGGGRGAEEVGAAAPFSHPRPGDTASAVTGWSWGALANLLGGGVQAGAGDRNNSLSASFSPGAQLRESL